MDSIARRRILIALIVGCAVLLTAFGYQVTVFVLRGMQVRNCADLQTYMALVEAYRKQLGAYPPSLIDAVELAGPRYRSSPKYSRLLDNWGNPVLYQSDGSRFLLVSFGMGGQPDGIDYWAARDASSSFEGRCSFSTDTFASEKGIHRCCGK